jgi:hypothetical protein
MSKKYVRKQLLLDPEDLFYVQQIIKSKPQYTSLSQFVRELLKEHIHDKSENQTNLLKSNTGFVKNGGFKTEKPEDLSQEIDKVVYEL